MTHNEFWNKEVISNWLPKHIANIYHFADEYYLHLYWLLRHMHIMDRLSATLSQTYSNQSMGLNLIWHFWRIFALIPFHLCHHVSLNNMVIARGVHGTGFLKFLGPGISWTFKSWDFSVLKIPGFFSLRIFRK